ncbi:MAG TPA: GAF domain-containing protein, partial [Anaerovoracaceae bacterium]|nr:GAF domain-containing protein [Anaerovoracaceae bacterium]
LVVEKASGNIVQVSENASQIFNVPFAELPVLNFSQFCSTPFMASPEKNDLPQHLVIAGKSYLGIYHDYPDYFILEINLESENENIGATFVNVFHELREAMTAIELAESINSICEIAALEMKKASGFDKVMIYRFDENWNGFVIAEEKEDDMESYLHLTFPASDIPRQARELYLRNSYRFIPDRNYNPVKLHPVINPLTNTFLDMSDCNVRGVSMVHLEYLKNMGVTASMSTRIIRDNKLWGLIACHHKTPMLMNYKMCSVFEFLSNIISSRIVTLETQEKQLFSSNLSLKYSALISETYRSDSLFDTLLNEETNILDLFNAEGAVINYNGTVTRKGTVPEGIDIEDIILWLNTKPQENIYFTNSLSLEYDYAKDYSDIASGMLAIPFDKSTDHYILLFRPEATHVINWGGNPEERINFESDLKIYHPRYSFKIWQEKVSGISQPWQESELEMAQNLREFIKAFLNGKEYSHAN